MEVDICIIGAGIVGLATAYQLSLHSKYKIVVIEKESTFAAHQTGHNSGVIHSGIYYTPGSLRAINCKRGYDLLLDFCNKHDVEYDVCGKVIVATRVEDTPALDKIMRHGEANGLVGIKRIGREETLEHEPYVNAVESIWVPQSGIIDYKKVCQKYADLLEDNGQIILYDNELVEIREEHDYIWAIGKRQEIKSRLLINCAGLYSDKVSKMTMPEIDLKILPFRGEYYNLSKEKEYLVNHLIYPVPNPHFPFLGVHYTRMINGGIEAGPNAVLAFKREGYSRWDFNAPELLDAVAYSGFRQLAFKYWRQGLGELHRSYSKKAFVKALQHLIPDVIENDLSRGNSGVRAMACRPDGELSDDFEIYEKKRVINICNAPSPAATASLAIGETITKKALAHLKDY